MLASRLTNFQLILSILCVLQVGQGDARGGCRVAA